MKNLTRKRQRGGNNNEGEYENQELIERLAEADVAWFREQLDAKIFGPNDSFSYSYDDFDTLVTYEGTLIGFLAAMATREFHTGAVPKKTIETMVNFFVSYGETPETDFFVDTTNTHYEYDRMYSPISLFIQTEYNALAKKLAKEIAKRRGWTEADTRLVLDEIETFQFYEEGAYEKWQHFFEELETVAEREHRAAMAPVLKNIENIPRQQAQKEETIGKKRQLLMEFGHLQPIPELSGFEGGPNWRKHMDYLRKLNQGEAVNMEEFQKHLNYPLYNYSRAQTYLYPSQTKKTRRRKNKNRNH